MKICTLCASLLVFTTLGLSWADASGWLRAASTPADRQCYSVPLVVYGGWGYAYPPMYLSANGLLAQPTAAPPSSEPPLLKKIEMPRADNDKPGRTDRCRVGFWNLSGKDVTLVVDGKAWPVMRDRAVTLQLPHDFVWQIDQRPAQSVRVADDKSVHEIVIR